MNRNSSILADAWPHFESVTARPAEEKTKPARLTGGQERPERLECLLFSWNRLLIKPAQTSPPADQTSVRRGIVSPRLRIQEPAAKPQTAQ